MNGTERRSEYDLAAAVGPHCLAICLGTMNLAARGARGAFSCGGVLPPGPKFAAVLSLTQTKKKLNTNELHIAWPSTPHISNVMSMLLNVPFLSLWEMRLKMYVSL